MKKTSSVVWRFFDRLEENNRCLAVVCKLCDTQYKYFGNTTNLRTHLVNKHPIQWELLQNGSLDESTFRAFDEDDSLNQSISASKRRKYSRGYKDESVRYSVSVDLNDREDKRNKENSMPIIKIQRVNVLENHSEADIDHGNDEETINVVHHIENRGSDEEWLNDEIYETVETYEPKRKKMKYKTIKQEITSPQPKVSSYYVQPTTVNYPKQERVVVDTSPRKDEYAVFGEYIANKLRKIKASQTRGNIQQLMTTILWQAEYGVYDSMETVKRVIMHSVQEMPSGEETVIQTEQMAQAETPEKETDGS